MKQQAWLTIGALSRATGIPTATLRTWERRYGVPTATRKPSGHRLYTQASVDHLLAIRRALELGHRPAEILGLAPRALEALTSVEGASPDAAATSAGVQAARPRSAARVVASSRAAIAPSGATTEGLLSLVSSFDREQLVSQFHAAATEHGLVRFLDHYAEPFLRELGEARREGGLGVRHEQFAAACLADTLRDLRHPYDERASGPLVAATALPGDPQDVGVLMQSLIAAAREWRVVYLGVGTPIDELVLAAEELPLEAVLVSIAPRAPQAYAFALVLDLRRKLPERIALWVFASGFAVVARGAQHFGNYDAFDRHLESITVHSPAGG